MNYASRTKRVQNFRWAAARSFPFSRQGTGGWTTRALPLGAERSNRAGAG